MATIRKRVKSNGKISYTAWIRIKGYPSMSATFERLTDAREWAAENETKMKRGKHIKDAEAKKHTLAELIDRYIEKELPQRKSDVKKFSTQLKWWKSEIGSYLLSDITPPLLSKCKDVLTTEPSEKPKNGRTTRTNATINRYMASLSIVFTRAVNEWGWMEENPMKKVTKKKEPKGRIRYLTDSEVTTLLQACRQISDELYLFTKIALATGARYSEILNLTWQNVDLKHKKFYFMDTKNGEDRGVSITPLVYDEIKEFKKIRNIKSNYIFTMPDGKKLIYMRGQFANALKDAKIKDFRFHDLRHTSASYLARGGASLLDIATILGHKTMAMVQRYSHLTDNHTAKVLENMNNIMFEGINR